MSNNLKVLHLTRKPFQFSLGTSFIYLQIKNHINFNPFQGCCIDYPPQLDNASTLYSNGIEIFCKKFYDKIYFKLFKHISKKTAKNINEYINFNDISIIHFHYGSDATIYKNLIKILKVPFVVSFYGYDYTSFPKLYLGLGKILLNHIVFKYSNYILAMSPDMKNELIKLGCNENKILVHYFGNETNIFCNKNRIYNKTKKMKLLIVANLTEKKGHLFLLKALVKLKNINCEFYLTIVGEGILENKIKQFVSENNLSENVEYKKNIPYGTQEMINEYLNADIYVQPSITSKNNDKEGIPGAMIEAMASGLPIVSTYHAGIPYIIKDNETGLLVNEWDINHLCDNIFNLITNSKLRERLGMAGQEYVLNELDINIKIKELENIYSLVINHN